MPIVLNLSNYTISEGTGPNAVDSPETLASICTPAQMQRFAENIIGERFPRGTTKTEGAKILYAAMLKKIGGAEEEPAAEEPAAEEPAAEEPAAEEPAAEEPAADEPPRRRSSVRKKSTPALTKETGYNSVSESINSEYAGILENLANVKEHVSDYSGIVNKVKEEQKEKLESLKIVKKYLD